MQKQHTAVLYAVMAAVFYGISSPFSKLLLINLSPAFMAALLYLGAGLAMLAVKAVSKVTKTGVKEARITKKELPYVIGMIILDIAAPIFLMLGLTTASAAAVSLLNNFEIVATAVIALVIFKEAIGKRLWAAIALITVSSILLSVESFSSMTFSAGALFALLACICWGLENNCTRMLSLKDPVEIVIIKGFGSGLGALIIAFAVAGISFNPFYILMALILGGVAYGLSIYCYIFAQRELGAARTSAYYAAAPFVGVILSFLIFGQALTISFAAALILMLLGAWFAVFEKHSHAHVHTALEHEHRHNHADGHHNHIHSPAVKGEHSHGHTHENLKHSHAHTPDLHHTHNH